MASEGSPGTKEITKKVTKENGNPVSETILEESVVEEPEEKVILAGTNDIAGNNGPIECEHIVENIVSMAELALAAGIRPILCSVLPAAKYPWRPEIESVPEKIAALNARLQQYAAERGLTWVDYYGAMDAGDGSMRSEYTKDGVHPTPEGYTVMESVIRPALAEWLP